MEADTADEAIDFTMDNYKDSISLSLSDTVEDIECEGNAIYYTENGIPCRVLFSAIERQA